MIAGDHPVWPPGISDEATSCGIDLEYLLIGRRFHRLRKAVKSFHNLVLEPDDHNLDILY